MDQSSVHHAKPIYEVLPGWKQNIGGCRTFEDLPVNAQRFVEFVERKAGGRISVIGVGPRRDQVIERHEIVPRRS